MSISRTDKLNTHRFFSLQPTIHRDIELMVLGLDFDGCTDKRVARAKLSDDVANFVVDHPEIERVAVIISSLRQTFLLDYFNANRNQVDEQGRQQSCTALDEDLLQDMYWKIELLFKKNRIDKPVPQICFHSILLSDIYNDLPEKTTFRKMKEFNHYARKPKSNSVVATNKSGQQVILARYNQQSGLFEADRGGFASYEFADTTKVLTLWTQIHYFRDIYGAENPFVFRFVDDNEDIIALVTAFFVKHPHLVPKDCYLESLYLSSNYGHYPPEFRPNLIVKGTGAVHMDYESVCRQVVRWVDAAVRAGENAHEAIQRAILYYNPIPVKRIDSDEELANIQSGMNPKAHHPNLTSPNSVATDEFQGISL